MLKQEKTVRLFLDEKNREEKCDLTYKINFVDFLKELGMLEKGVDYRLSGGIRTIRTKALVVHEVVFKPLIINISDNFVSKTIEIIEHNHNKKLSILSTIELQDDINCETVDITKPFLELITKTIDKTKEFTISLINNDIVIYPENVNKK